MNDPQVVSQAHQSKLPSKNNSAGASSRIYYQNDPATSETQPYYTCDVLSGLVAWNTTNVQARSDSQIIGSQSGNNLCFSVGLPASSTSTTGPNPKNCYQSNADSNTPNDGSYVGPYLIQNTSSGLFIEQNFTLSPLASASFYCFGGLTLSPGQSWAPGNDVNRLRFTRGNDSNGSPTLTIVVPNSVSISALKPNAGAVTGGTAVTVTGSGFLPGATATLGGERR